MTRRDGPAMEIHVELPVELPTLEHTLREAARGHVECRRAMNGFGLDHLPYGVVGRPLRRALRRPARSTSAGRPG